MENTIIAVREKKMRSLKASTIFEVQRKTLQTLANKSSLPPKRAAAVNLRLKAVPVEEEVVKYMLLMEATFHGLTRKRREMVTFMSSSRNGLQHPFGSPVKAGRS